MNRRITSIFCALGLFVLSPGMPTAKGDNILFYTDTGTLYINGTPSSTFFGVPMQTSVVDGKMQFRILGDLHFISSDLVTAAGSRPLSLWAGNNVTVASGAVLNFDAVSGQPGQLGGGSGGASVLGGTQGSGASSNATVAAGGAGGLGGFRYGSGGGYWEGLDGAMGEPGTRGIDGVSGGSGSFGQPGQAGFNNATGVRDPGANGPWGVGGTSNLNLPAGGGAGIGANSSADDGQPGGNGNVGSRGYDGQSGSHGGDGLGGLNNITGLLLSGGAGGSSGGSGGGGGGGASGGSGSGGGGGGGGGAEEFVIVEPGGNGGEGGYGGRGGIGGNGSAGGAGVVGGAGGAAVEIIAQGYLNFAGSISARGAHALQSDNADLAESGLNGAAGAVGESGYTSETGLAGHGGAGGAGGAGGRGGNGGQGGDGGYGGGGAGGTVLFKSTLFSAAGGTIDASGGLTVSLEFESFGGDGRYLTAENGEYLPNYGTAVGARREDFFNQGSGGVNPFVDGNSTITANVIGLAGGADVYGLKEGVSAADSYFDAVRAGAPAGAVAAIMRRAVGPTDGEAYYFRDLLMIVNLTDGPLASPMLGVAGGSFQTPLLQQGFARNPAFGGAGPAVLSQLPAGGVFATLVDHFAFDILEVNVSVGDATLQGIDMNAGAVVYLTLAPLAGDYNGDDIVDAADYVVWRKTDGTQQGFNLWRAHFGETAGGGTGAGGASPSQAGVPEPATLVLLMVAAAGICLRRCNCA